MESGIIEITLIDGRKFHVHYQNRTQKEKLLMWYSINRPMVKEFKFLAKGVHSTKDFLTIMEQDNNK